MKEWYAHLPPTIRFPVDTSPLFDPRKSFLRAQYIVLFVVIGWPSVLRLLQLQSQLMDAPEPMAHGETIVTLKAQAQECLSSCLLFLGGAEELLTKRTMGLAFTLWGASALLSCVLVTYGAPAFPSLGIPKQDREVLAAYDLLQTWNHLPAIHRSQGRMEKMMHKAGYL